MPRLNHSDTILLTSKKITVQEFIKTLIYLPAEKLNQYFMKLGLKFPRETRIFVLRENLREKVVETRKSRLTLADELNYRLSWFAEFTETQLENLLVFFNDPTINKSYLEDLWLELLTIMAEQGVNAKEFEDLYILSLQNEVEELPPMETFNRDIKTLFYDEEGKIDGLTPARIRPVLYKSSTLAEIRDFGAKYDVNVPRRLKKNELLAIIVKELKDRGDYTEELENEIKKMPVILMQRFATDNDIKASTELKKEEIIEYVLVNAKETKQEYFEPTEQDYDLEPEVEVEAVVEEVAQEEVTHMPSADLQAILLEMRRLRESVEQLRAEVHKEPVQKEVIIERVVERAPVVEEVVEKAPEVEEVVEPIPVVEEVIEEVVTEPEIEEELVEEIIEEIVEEELAEVVEEEIVEEEVVEPEEEIIEPTPVIEEEIEEEVVIEPAYEEEVEEAKPKKAKKKRKCLFRRAWFWIFLIIFLILLLILYFYLTYYNIRPIFMDKKYFDGFGNWLNKYIKISGKGLLDKAHDVIGKFHTFLRKIPFIDKLVK